MTRTTDLPRERALLSMGVVRARAARVLAVAILVVGVALAAPVEGAALVSIQGSPLASQSLGRGYTHMFIAYALAWLLVLAWAVSIGRRLARARRAPDEE